MRNAIANPTQQRESNRPATVSALLRTLQMIDKPARAQRLALRGWLSEHPPGEELRLSLRSNGFGSVLAEIGVSKRPIPQITATHKLGA